MVVSVEKMAWGVGIAYPENERRVLAVPAASSMMGEETPGVIHVFILHKNADTGHLRMGVLNILFPNN